MKFSLSWIIILICMGILLTHLPMQSFIFSDSGKAVTSTVANNQVELPEDMIRDTARLITLRVFAVDRKDWEKGGLDTIYISASGILINQKNIKQDEQSIYLYLVLTNKHVLKSPSKNYYVQTPDGLIHQAFIHQQANFNKDDLGMLWFYSPYFYEKAVLAKSFNLTTKQQIFVSGFPCKLTTSLTMDCPAEFTFTNGKGILVDKPLQDGYQIGYTNEIQEGMSGGPVLNNKGQVIGINGRGKDDNLNSIQYKYANGSGSPELIQKETYALGIPIETYLKLTPKNPFDKIAPPRSVEKYIIYEQKAKSTSNENNKTNKANNDKNDKSLNSEWKLFFKILITLLIIIPIIFPLFIIMRDVKEFKNIFFKIYNRQSPPIQIAKLQLVNKQIASLSFGDQQQYPINLLNPEIDVVPTGEDTIIINKKIQPDYDKISVKVVKPKESYCINLAENTWTLERRDNENEFVVIELVSTLTQLTK